MARARIDPRQARALRRRGAFREPNRLYLLVSEGTVTEPSYFDGMVQHERIHGVSVRTYGAGADPFGVVDYAIRLMAENRKQVRAGRAAKFDEVWVLFDVDEIKAGRIAAAKAKAKANGIKVAVSNPCFEVWLLLHHSDHNASITTTQVQRKLLKIDPRYDKRVDYRQFAEYREAATTRAEALDRSHDREKTDGNPSTGVWQLVLRLFGGGD